MSKETERGGQSVNKRRVERGLGEVHIVLDESEQAPEQESGKEKIRVEKKEIERTRNAAQAHVGPKLASLVDRQMVMMS